MLRERDTLTSLRRKRQSRDSTPHRGDRGIGELNQQECRAHQAQAVEYISVETYVLAGRNCAISLHGRGQPSVIICDLGMYVVETRSHTAFAVDEEMLI